MKSVKFILSSSMKLVSIVALAIFASVPQVLADSKCIKFTDELHSTSPSPIGPFSGVAMVTIGNTITTANFIAVPMGTPITTDDGTIKLNFADLWAFEDGSMVTGVNEALGDPTGNPGELRVNGRITFTGGTGKFANIFGRASFHGHVQLFPDNTAIASTTVKGRICGFNTTDDEAD